MFNTLQAAFGTWPNEVPSTVNDGSPPKPIVLGINERYDFEPEDQRPPSISPVFSTRLEDSSNGRTLGPPDVIPAAAIRETSDELIDVSDDNGDPDGPSVKAGQISSKSSDSQPGRCIPMVSRRDQPSVAASQESTWDTGTRSPFPPPPDEDLQREKEANWTLEARKIFHEMVTAEGYVNRYRMHMKKRQRLAHYLEHPDLEPMLCDGSKDHQTKYQAPNWTLISGQLCRKPEAGRVGKFRRHLDEMEAWEVITTEHLRSGHLGRDKLRKVLEQRYIGYTLQEIMFVLRECKRCSGREQRACVDAEVDDEVLPDAPLVVDCSGHATSAVESQSATNLKGPFARKQSSNFMWF